MIEYALFHNGSIQRPYTRRESGDYVWDGSLEELNQEYQAVIPDQIRAAILAEKLGFQYYFQTEHHFNIEGIEFSPNPLMTSAALAMVTSRIRLGQAANIVPWHHPVRLAEMAAMVDVMSGGRLEMGVGRGYQPREAEVLSAPLGSAADLERNRARYEEGVELLLKAWTEPSFSHHGEFWSVPPTWTQWNHSQSVAQLDDWGMLDRVLKVHDESKLREPGGLLSGNVTMNEISVFPRPLQQPHPQLWDPVSSPRSVQFAAQKGINPISLADPASKLKTNVDFFMQAAEDAGWPDRNGDGRPFKRGWDSERKRGYAVGRTLYAVDSGIGNKERARKTLGAYWNYFRSFAVAGSLAAGLMEPDDPDLENSGPWIIGSKQQIIEGILDVKETAGYEDLCFLAYFEALSSADGEAEEQMQYFAEEIMPVLNRECGGTPDQVEVPTIVPTPNGRVPA